MSENAGMETERVEAAAQEPAAEAAAVQEPERVETMEDYVAELEASFKRVRIGDIVTGIVVGVTDTQVLLELKYFSNGIIEKKNLSNDPDFNIKEEIHPGDEITATVIRTDDGEGNLVLSRKEANDRLAWEKLRTMLAERTIVPVTVTEVVNGGVVANLEGLRGFIPASRLDASYVENLEEWKGRRVEVTVITADEANHKLVLSGREAAREKLKEEKNRRIARCEVGAILEGTVETIKPYGAFVSLENGLSGLVHISQISKNRIKHPGAVLKEGQKVTVKIISTADNKISLSMKEVVPDEAEEEEVFQYRDSGEVTHIFAELLKDFKF